MNNSKWPAEVRLRYINEVIVRGRSYEDVCKENGIEKISLLEGWVNKYEMMTTVKLDEATNRAYGQLENPPLSQTLDDKYEFGLTTEFMKIIETHPDKESREKLIKLKMELDCLKKLAALMNYPNYPTGKSKKK
jgi:transposase-like protein